VSQTGKTQLQEEVVKRDSTTKSTAHKKRELG